MITAERVEKIFADMNSFTLELASEASALGPQYFQDMIATCRNYLNRVSLITSELNQVKLTLSSSLRALEAAYDMDFNDKLANDDHVRKLASIDDRKSTVEYMLRTQKQELTKLRSDLHTLDSVYKVVTHRSRELHATMNAIKDQRRLMQTEISSGAMYGDERTKGKPIYTGDLDLDGLDTEEIEAALEDGAKNRVIVEHLDSSVEISEENLLDDVSLGVAKVPDVKVFEEDPEDAAVMANFLANLQ